MGVAAQPDSPRGKRTTCSPVRERLQYQLFGGFSRHNPYFAALKFYFLPSGVQYRQGLAVYRQSDDAPPP